MRYALDTCYYQLYLCGFRHILIIHFTAMCLGVPVHPNHPAPLNIPLRKQVYMVLSKHLKHAQRLHYIALKNQYASMYMHFTQ